MSARQARSAGGTAAYSPFNRREAAPGASITPEAGKPGTLAGSTRAGQPGQVAGPDQAGPGQARPDRARPDRARPDRARPDRTEPGQTGPGRTGPRAPPGGTARPH